MTSVYLDSASSTPLHPVAEQALNAAAEDGWCDPGRQYSKARKARQLLDAARLAVADVIDVSPAEVAFTTNGTNAVHAGILGLLNARRQHSDLFIHSAVEHSSVMHCAEFHQAGGGRTQTIPVSRTGRVDLTNIEDLAYRTPIAAAAIQSANHEVGTTQPIGEIAQILGDTPLLVDAAQSLGRHPIDPGWAVLTASARKWGGPAGVGVMVAKKSSRWRNPWPGDAYAMDAPGALNIPLIVAAAASLRAVSEEQTREDARLRSLTERIRVAIPQLIPFAEIVGDDTHRVPHIVTISYPWENGEPIMIGLDRAGFSVSAGSACTASSLRPSHVLEAMGVLATGNIRISMHRDTQPTDIDAFLDALPAVIAELRTDAGVDGY